MLLFVLGDIFCDILAIKCPKLPEWGGDVQCESIDLLAGGSSLNSCCHAERYIMYLKQKALRTEDKDATDAERQKDPELLSDVVIKFFSSVGDDAMGELCKKRLQCYVQDDLMDVNGILTIKDKPTGSCIVISSGDDRSFISERGVMNAMTMDWFKGCLFDKDFHLIGAKENQSHLHIGGYYNLTKVKGSKDLLTLLKVNRAHNITTSLNPQYDATELWNDIEYICPFLSIYIGNELETCKITNEREFLAGAKKLRSWGCELVVVTTGEKGAFAISAKKDSAGDDDLVVHSSSPTILSEHIVDFTGAGDCFTGVFIVEWIAHKNIQESLNRGCQVASRCLTVNGGSNTEYSISFII